MIFTGIGLIFTALALLFWVWMLVLAIKNPRLGDAEKICWVLAIVFLNFLGGLLYYFFGSKKTSWLFAGANRRWRSL